MRTPEPADRSELIEHLRTDHAMWANEINYGSMTRMTDRALHLSHQEDHDDESQNHRHQPMGLAMMLLATGALVLGFLATLYGCIWLAVHLTG